MGWCSEGRILRDACRMLYLPFGTPCVLQES